MQLEHIASAGDPRLAPYRSLRRPMEHYRQGLFVAEGRLVVERLLRSGLRVRSVLVLAEWLERLEPLLQGQAGELPVYVAPRQLVEQLVGFNFHQGLLALAECPPELTLAQAVERAAPPRTFVALDGLSSAENVGTICRSAAALGAQAVLAGETSASPYLRRAVRNSLGGVFRLAVLHAENLAEALGELHTRYGFGIVAADVHASQTLDAAVFPRDVCLVLGHEEFGLSPPVRAACDQLVRIRMEQEMDALNVAAAGAIFLHELRARPSRSGSLASGVQSG